MSNFPTGNRTQLSWVDVYKVARQAGFSPAAAVIATAITQPEADRMPGIQQSGQPYSKTGWGLWQITPGNSVPSVGTDDQLLDPLTNARAAYAKYHAAGDTFRPWTTYTNGAYKAWIAAASAAANTVGDNIGSPAGLGGSVGSAPALGGSVGGGSSPADIVTAINQLIGSGGRLGQAQVDTVLNSDLSDAAKAVVAAVSGAVNWLDGLVTAATTLIQGLLWLVNPANWVRIIAALVGGVSLVTGAVLVARSG